MSWTAGLSTIAGRAKRTRQLGDGLVHARHANRLGLDLLANLLEVVVSPTVDVQEVAEFPLLLPLAVGRFRRRQVDQLEDQRPSGDDAGAAREEVLRRTSAAPRHGCETRLADDSLEHR